MTYGKAEYEADVIKATDRKMAAMPLSWRYRWCSGGLCACMGCANRSGGMSNRADWDRWVLRNPEPEKRYCEHCSGNQYNISDETWNCEACGTNFAN